MEATPFEDLPTADLVVDRNYRGGSVRGRGADPIAKLLPVGNAGGFRFLGRPTADTVRCLVLYTSGNDPDWPDRLDTSQGTFTYYGDNKRPGADLHATPRKGNLALSVMFSRALAEDERSRVPPTLLFSKGEAGADVRFRGLLVPGSVAVPVDEQLVAIWRSVGDQRFQNYRASFSVLDVRTVDRGWLDQIVAGDPMGDKAPSVWRKWVRTGVAERLVAPRSVEHRTRAEQLPSAAQDIQILQAIYSHFVDRPHDFEACAAQIWLMLAPATEELVMTPRSRDGGRDAVGTYRIGPTSDLIRIDFAMEAKCYAPGAAVGVRETSRLISRLRHRNFGVLVTTSWVNIQAYKEIREDGHPVAIVSGSDIVAVLRERGWGTATAVKKWLESEFSAGSKPRLDLGFDPLGLAQPDRIGDAS